MQSLHRLCAVGSSAQQFGRLNRLSSVHHLVKSRSTGVVLSSSHLKAGLPCVSYVSSRNFTWSFWPTEKSPLQISLTDAPASQAANQASGAAAGYIPPPPVSPEVALTPDAANLITEALAEPSFSSIGLGGYGPVGLTQYAMEYLHIGLDIPWWTCIAIGTLTVRLALFPLVIMAQRNAAKMTNNMPQIQVLQLKMTQARQSGNAMEAARYGQEMMQYMKEKGISPLRNMIVPLAQAPIFISFFMALRGMANTPVGSMREGGLWWFTDLTVADPYYLLPLLTSTTMFLTIKLGTDAANFDTGSGRMIQYFLRAMPVIMFPFIMNFPGGILCYWLSTNLISLMQVGILRIPSVRNYFNIEQLKKYSPESLPVKPKGFVEGFKESWTNMKITKQMEERQKFDEMQFKRAGLGPVTKTYKYDPTKQAPVTTQKIIQKGMSAAKKS